MFRKPPFFPPEASADRGRRRRARSWTTSAAIRPGFAKGSTVGVDRQKGVRTAVGTGRGRGAAVPVCWTSQDVRERVGTTVAGRAFDVLDPSRMNRTGREGVGQACHGRTGTGEGEDMADGRRTS